MTHTYSYRSHALTYIIKKFNIVFKISGTSPLNDLLAVLTFNIYLYVYVCTLFICMRVLWIKQLKKYEKYGKLKFKA